MCFQNLKESTNYEKSWELRKKVNKINKQKKKKINFICTYPQELRSVIWKGDHIPNSNENHMIPQNNLRKDMQDLHAKKWQKSIRHIFLKTVGRYQLEMERLRTVKILIIAKYRVESNGIRQVNSKMYVDE